MNVLKVFFDVLKVFILFIGCTVLFYYGMIWINQEYQSYNRYTPPEEGAVKASANLYQPENQTWWDRAVLFYLNGE